MVKLRLQLDLLVRPGVKHAAKLLVDGVQALHIGIGCAPALTQVLHKTHHYKTVRCVDATRREQGEKARTYVVVACVAVVELLLEFGDLALQLGTKHGGVRRWWREQTATPLANERQQLGWRCGHG